MSTKSPHSSDTNSLIEILNRRRRHENIRIQIDSYLKSVRESCQNKTALQEAKELVPICDLVQNNLDILEGNFEDNLLPILTDWFSKDFFQWFTAPNCERCNEELKYHDKSINREGNPVEIYKCQSDNCEYSFDFIRHNDPAILLITKTGRCGEWANCFMLILTALDYEARLVLDTTDHVWNEVWSEAQQRWIHVDPCEAIVDAPLLYELGWSKNLEYCIAFGQHEALDVTRRYTTDFEAAKVRRDSCDESWLEQYLDQITGDLLEGVSQEIKDTVLDHRRRDIEFMKQPKSVDALDRAKFQQRKTGTIAWRIERGEYSPSQRKLFIVTISPACELKEGLPIFTLQYNCDKDLYDSSSENCQTKGWSSLIYVCENMDHKFERDWKTSYLARYETCPWNEKGEIQWRFDFSKLEKWDKLEVQLLGQIYPETTITLQLVTLNADDESFIDEIELKLNDVNIVTNQQLKQSSSILAIVARLAGGSPEDSVAWQKPQLFRQTRGKDAERSTFSFIVY